MLRKKRRISTSDDDPMSGISNLSDAMLVLALGFLVFAIMALSVHPDIVSDATSHKSFKDVSTGESFSKEYNSSGGMENSKYSEIGKVYEDPNTGKLVLVSN